MRIWPPVRMLDRSPIIGLVISIELRGHGVENPQKRESTVEPLRGSKPPAISGCGLRPVNIGSVKPFKGFTWFIPSLGHVTRWQSRDSADARALRSTDLYTTQQPPQQTRSLA